jgi:hypothetical protein
MSPKIQITVGFVFLALITGVMWNLYGRSKPVFESGKGVSNIITNGNPEESIALGQKYFTALKEANWDPIKVPFSMAKLPDQRMAEVEEMRDPRMDPWCVFPVDDPVSPEIAMYTEIYVKRNIKVYSGDRGTSHPEGFFIVFYRDGTVKKVPVGEVRITSVPGHFGRQTYVFPGSKMYKPTLPLAYR